MMKAKKYSNGHASRLGTDFCISQEYGIDNESRQRMPNDCIISDLKQKHLTQSVPDIHLK